MIKYFMHSHLESLQRATEGSSGYDLRADLSVDRIIDPGHRWLISTGLYLEMPKGLEGQIRSRSGMAIHHGVIVLNAPGTIDSDYRGEIKVTLLNTSGTPFTVLPRDRIAQLVFCPVMPFMEDLVHEIHHGRDWNPRRVMNLSDLDETVRGSGGHGSTGR